MDKGISLFEKKQLERDIKVLDKNEHFEILNIIKKHQQKFSKNNKGVFFNLKYIDEPTLREIISFVDFCKKNSILLNKNSVKNFDAQTKNNDTGHMLEKLSLPIKNPPSVSLKDNKYKNFTFKNYLDKISIIPKKEFQNKQTDAYPNLISVEEEFTGHSNRLLKKCKNHDVTGTVPSNTSDVLEVEANIN